MKVLKFNKSEYKKIIAHVYRSKDEYGNYNERTNPDIDFSLTPYNYCYELDMTEPKTIYERINKYMTEYKVRNKTTVILGSWVIQTPDNWEGDTKPFFDAVFKILKKKYPYYIDGFVHIDEIEEFDDYRTFKETGKIETRTGREHMHFLFCPIKDGQFNAKAILTKQELNDFHSWLEVELEKELGFFMPLQKDETRERHKKLKELGNIPGLLKEGETIEYLPMRELKKRTKAMIYDEYMKQNELIEGYKAEVAEYKRQVEDYKNKNLDEIIAMNTEYVRKDDVQKMIGEIFDMLEMDLPKDRLKKYRKVFDKFGFVVDKIKNFFIGDNERGRD